jgi:hypothetical protein
LELFRVSSKEVRLYPLQQAMISQPYKQMSELLSFLKKEGIKYEIKTVNKMLRLIR